jgi:hypothetical protein
VSLGSIINRDPFGINVPLDKQKENLLNALNADKQRNQNIANLEQQVQNDLKNNSI